MKFLRVLLYVLLMAVVCHAGEVADKQMDQFTNFLKKAKYKEAATALLEYVADMGEEQRSVNIAQYAAHFSTFIKQHGKVLNYTKLRTRRLAKNHDETVYQINCDKSAWLVMIREYVSPSGKSFFWELEVLTEDDVFKFYERKYKETL
ncbi:MAG: hypothetical protein J5615_06850 [Fibrobacter sp.]|nr:hypothetical protein [Fibrobacter sp.]